MSAITVASCLIFDLTAGAQITNQTQRALSLRECLEMALAHNLDVQIERYSPQIRGAQLGASEGIYDPVLTLNASRTFTKQPGTFDAKKFNQSKPTIFQLFTTNTLGQEWPNEKTLDSAGASLGGRLPTGLTYNFYSRFDHFDATTIPVPSLLLPQPDAIGTGYLPPSFNSPSSNNYSTTAGLTLTQPLLKDFWTDLYRLNIYLNQKNLQISKLAFEGELMTNVTLVATAYYRLILAREQINVQTSALQAAQQLVEDTRRKVQGGVLPPLAQQQAESSVETFQTALFAAEQAYLEQENVLKSLVTDNYQSWAGVTLAPSEDLSQVVELPANRAASWANALLRRPDILQMQLDLQKQDIILTFTHNQLFPSLNMVGSYAWQATEPTFSQSLNTLRNGSFPSYSVGAVFAIPVANVTASSEYQASTLAKKQALLRFKRLQQSVITEIDTAVKLTETTFKQVSATRNAQKFSEAALESVQKQYTNGALTSYFVVDAQRRHALAHYAEIRALADYHIALARLALSEGTALERNHIELKLK